MKGGLGFVWIFQPERENILPWGDEFPLYASMVVFLAGRNIFFYLCGVEVLDFRVDLRRRPCPVPEAPDSTVPSLDYEAIVIFVPTAELDAAVGGGLGHGDVQGLAAGLVPLANFEYLQTWRTTLTLKNWRIAGDK